MPVTIKQNASQVVRFVDDVNNRVCRDVAFLRVRIENITIITIIIIGLFIHVSNARVNNMKIIKNNEFSQT